MSLNRTASTFLAANFRLNLGTRSTAANAVVFNGKTLRLRRALLGMQGHPMRDEVGVKPGKSGPSISRSPSSPIAGASSAPAWPARSVAVAEAPPAEPQVVEDGRGCRADRHRQVDSSAQRQDQTTRRSPRDLRSYRRLGSDWRTASTPTAGRLLAARKGLALG